MPLTEHQWQITSPDGSVDLVFGTADTGVQTTHSPDLGQRSVRHTDAARPREDGVSFGPDFDNAETLTFEANVLTDSHLAQVDLLDHLRSTWKHRVFRKDANAHAILKSCVAGRIRRCYGRPRRFAETDADLTEQGYTGVIMDFTTYDATYYDDIEQVASVPISPPDSIGFTTPIVTSGETAFQTETLDPGQLPGLVSIQGQDTWAVVTFHGPVTSPALDLGDFVVALDATIPDGVSVTVDPRPWSRGVRRSDGARLAGALTYDTPPMRDLKLPLGQYQITYRGSDATGTSFCEVAWRGAHSRP